MRNGRIYEIFLRFPFNIDPTTAKAHFTLEKRILNILASVILFKKDNVSLKNYIKYRKKTNKQK